MNLSDEQLVFLSEVSDFNMEGRCPFEDRNKIRKITLQVNNDISPMPYRPEDFNDGDYFVKEILETGIRIV